MCLLGRTSIEKLQEIVEDMQGQPVIYKCSWKSAIKKALGVLADVWLESKKGICWMAWKILWLSACGENGEYYRHRCGMHSTLLKISKGRYLLLSIFKWLRVECLML